jgi:hypothetical protein
MAKVTIVFAILLIALGLVGFYGTGGVHPTALIPTWWGVALGIGGFLAISPSESRRKIFMHINVTVGLLGFIGALVVAIQGYVSATSAGHAPDMTAFAAKLTMAGLLLIYVILCVRSFIAARRSVKG